MVLAARHRAVLGDAGLRPHPVQATNLHQTKGREADATILLLQPDEYHGNERPPYPKLSRLLYVVLPRARHRAYIAVPDDVHPLWQPLVEACEGASGHGIRTGNGSLTAAVLDVPGQDVGGRSTGVTPES
jgi:DNA helicase-2/ATP-dependent DNA helicase PcrA